MKKTYKHSLAAVATAVIVFNFTSCKYEDGPKISLKSKTARLAGLWNVESIDGEDLGSDFSLEMDFEKDGDLTLTQSYSYYGYSYDYDIKGEWEWGDKKETLEVTLDGGETIEFEIKRLTSEEFWFDYDGDEWILEKD